MEIMDNAPAIYSQPDIEGTFGSSFRIGFIPIHNFIIKSTHRSGPSDISSVAHLNLFALA